MRMRKLAFMLIAALSVALTGCSAFDSAPIEPKIIGTGNLHYEAKSGTWFVVVNSTQYTVANVTILDHNPRTASKTQNVEPVEGMLVTVFTSPHKTGIQAVIGKQSVEKIEKLCRSSVSEMWIILFFCIIVFGFVRLCLKAIATPRTNKVPVVNADV